MTRTDRTRWLKWFGHHRAPADVRLFCFHHAGGAAARFREWPDQLPRTIEPIAVQLPGRADRLRERPHDAMAPLVHEVVEVIEPLLDGPFAFYGLSMGGKVSWALAHALRDKGYRQPSALYLTNVAAPGSREGRENWNIGDDELLDYLRKMGGTPPELFAEPKLLAALLPTLRADLTVVDAYRYRPATPLDVPIRAFAAEDDPEGALERMAGWRAETTMEFGLEVVPGGHFLDPAGERKVVTGVVDDLERRLALLVDVP